MNKINNLNKIQSKIMQIMEMLQDISKENLGNEFICFLVNKETKIELEKNAQIRNKSIKDYFLDSVLIAEKNNFK